ncbi:MAG TPA: Ig-like domain-containing protein [Acidobacteriaceae bacterium]|nr:Ig-like domain-containing protein [Acidobacteriaceae bacterium]
MVTKWNTLKNNGVFTTWLASINQEAATLQQSQVNNFGRWPMLGIKVWPNSIAIGSYDGEVSYLTSWLNLRIAYLDSQFNGKAQTSTTLTVPSGTLRNGSPATLTAQVTGTNNPSGTVSFLSNGVLLGTGTLDGTGMASLTTSSLPVGNNAALQAVYNGNSTEGLSASSITAVAVVGPLVTTETNLDTTIATIGVGKSASFTVSVVANSGTTTPTGTVTFVANGKMLGSISLFNSGSAIFSTTNLPTGTVSVKAIYAGDNSCQGSSSNKVMLSVTT